MTSALGPFFAWLQETTIATTIAQSTLLTGLLSGIHLLGLTLLVGGALVSGLRLLGVLLSEQPVTEVSGTAARGMTVGLAISVTTGLLLFAARASTAAESGFFQLKMVVLLTAAVFHFAFYRSVARQGTAQQHVLQFAGALGLMLWFGVAVAGCAYILFE